MPSWSRRSFLRRSVASLSMFTSACSMAPWARNDERVDTKPPGSPGLTASGNWPSYRFDAGNTGANPDGTGVRSGTQYWRLNAGGPATVWNGTLYNVFSRDQDHKSLTYRDLSTAAVETRRQLVQYGVNGPPVVANGRVFVTTFIEVFCFDARNGEEKWRGPEMDGIYGQPAVQDEIVLINTSGFRDVSPHLRAFDAAGGEEVWRHDTGHNSDSTPAVSDDRVFIVSSGGLHAIDLTSGEEVYVVEANHRTTPVVHDETVYTIAACREDDELVALEAGDGTVQWRTPVETDSPPVVTDGIVYTLTTGGTAALDSEDGSVISSSSKTVVPVGLVGDVLYAVERGTVFALDVSKNLEQLWSLTTESVGIDDTVGREIYHVTPVDGAVYVSARDAFHGVGSE